MVREGLRVGLVLLKSGGSQSASWMACDSMDKLRKEVSATHLQPSFLPRLLWTEGVDQSCS